MRLSLYYHKKGHVMKKMHSYLKTLAIMLLAVLFIFVIAACGSENKAPANATPETTSSPTANPDESSVEKIYTCAVFGPLDAVYRSDVVMKSTIILRSDGTAEMIAEETAEGTPEQFPGLEETVEFTQRITTAGSSTVIGENTVHLAFNTVNLKLLSSTEQGREAYLARYSSFNSYAIPAMIAEAFSDKGYNPKPGSEESKFYCMTEYDVRLDDANAKAYIIKSENKGDNSSCTTYFYREDGLVDKTVFVSPNLDGESGLTRTHLYEYDASGSLTGYSYEYRSGEKTTLNKYERNERSLVMRYEKETYEGYTAETYYDESGNFASKTSVSNRDDGAVVTTVYRDVYDPMIETSVYPDGRIIEYTRNGDGTNTESTYYPGPKLKTVETFNGMGESIEFKYYDEDNNPVPALIPGPYDFQEVGISLDGVREDTYGNGLTFQIPSPDGYGFCGEISLTLTGDHVIFIHADVNDPVDSFARFIVDEEAGSGYGWTDGICFMLGKDKDKLYRMFFLKRSSNPVVYYLDYNEDFKPSSYSGAGYFYYSEKDDGSGWIAEAEIYIGDLMNYYVYGETADYIGDLFYFEIGIDLDAKLDGISFCEYSKEDFLSAYDEDKFVYEQSYINTPLIIK